MNICWYKDEKVGIFFDKIPDLKIRYATPFLTKTDVKKINTKPFINNNDIWVSLADYSSDIVYEFLIKKGYVWDGATIPRFFWRLIGPKTDNRFLVPSLIHDVLCENHSYIDDNRYFSTIVFERLLFVSKVNPVSRWLIKHSVDNFQKFCGW